jgi:16S rRNA (guanine527-N7)-methyltransferase
MNRRESANSPRSLGPNGVVHCELHETCGCQPRLREPASMTPEHVAAALIPYLEQKQKGTALPESLLLQVCAYLELLLRWNSRTNLTAIREAEEILGRHFGESFFAAQHLFPDRLGAGKSRQDVATHPFAYEAEVISLADVGSGAGFPGIPLKLWTAQFNLKPLQVTLIESRHKKATFLREAIRALNLQEIQVFDARAEDLRSTFDCVTLRAVEQFESILPVAARLVAPRGRLALLIGERQIAAAKSTLPDFEWEDPHEIPLSRERQLVVGRKLGESA